MTLPDMMSRVEPLKVHGKFTKVAFLPRYSLSDQTLIIAAFMVMRHPKFDGAFYGVVGAGYPDVTGLGRIVPNLISRKHTNSTTTGYDVTGHKLSMHMATATDFVACLLSWMWQKCMTQCPTLNDGRRPQVVQHLLGRKTGTAEGLAKLFLLPI